MEKFDLEAFQAKMAEIASGAATDAVQNVEAEKARKAEALEARKAEIAAEKKRIEEIAAGSTKAMVEELEAKMAKSNEEFAKAFAGMQEQLAEKSEEVSQLLAARNGAPKLSDAARAVRGEVSNDEQKAIDQVVLLAMCVNSKRKGAEKLGMFETEFGKRHMGSEVYTKLNQSSDVEVSSDNYETVFATNLLRDIQDNLIVAPLFQEVKMNSANMVIPIQPDYGTANWVSASVAVADPATPADTTNRTGSRSSYALTELTLSTHKLAAKALMTEDSSEDAIIAIVPLIRKYLVEAHANTIDATLVRSHASTVANMPDSLRFFANSVAAGAAVHKVVSGTRDKVVASDILEVRRLLLKYGMKIGDLAVLVSQKAYYDLMQDDAWQDVQQVGAAASKLNGEVGKVYGMTIIVTDKLDDTTTAGDCPVIIVNKSNFVMPRQRGLTVRTQFEVELDAEIIVATQRVGFHQYIADKGVAIMEWADA